MNFTDFLNEGKFSKDTVSGELTARLAKYIKADVKDTYYFLFGGAPGLGDEAMKKAEKLGWNDSGEYDAFWKKVFSRVEYTVLQALAADDVIDSESRLF